VFLERVIHQAGWIFTTRSAQMPVTIVPISQFRAPVIVVTVLSQGMPIVIHRLVVVARAQKLLFALRLIVVW